jgi:Transglycosylase SLT domain
MHTSCHRKAAGRHRSARCAALRLLSGLLFSAAIPTISIAQSGPVEQPAEAAYAAHVTEASQRFRIPERWILAVIEVESAGRTRAVSSAGAMGLMQIMPDTWAELRIRYRLGRDPFDPRDNILGGTAYLREMYDRFGSPGFLAAYNAGPERYRQHLDDGRPLPRETRNYIAKLMPMIRLVVAGEAVTTVPVPLDWREAPLFVERSQPNPMANPAQGQHRLSAIPATPPIRDGRSNDTEIDGVFAVQSRDERTP